MFFKLWSKEIHLTGQQLEKNESGNEQKVQ